MKLKEDRIETIKMLISSKEIGSQKELLDELKKEGFELTQATLSRDLKQLKVAKAASMNGKHARVPVYQFLWKHRRHQDPSGLCQQHRVQLGQQRHPGNFRNHRRRRHHLHRHQGWRERIRDYGLAQRTAAQYVTTENT